MDSLILEPLKYYKSVLKERHKENLEGHFDELVRRSGIDVEQNRATVKKYDAEMVKVNRQRKILGLWNALFITLIVVGIVGIILIIAALMDEIIDTGLLYAGLGCTAGGFLLAFFVVRPKKRMPRKSRTSCSLWQTRLRKRRYARWHRSTHCFALRTPSTYSKRACLQLSLTEPTKTSLSAS